MGGWREGRGGTFARKCLRIGVVIVLALLVLEVVFFACLHGYVCWGLTPRVRQDYGLELRVKRLWFNLFTGRLSAGEVRFSNPPGSAVPDVCTLADVTMDFDWLPLIRGVIRVASLDVRDVRMAVLRKGDSGEAQKRRGSGGGGSSGEGPPDVTDGAKDAVAGSTPLPRLSIGRVQASGVVEFCALTDGQVASRLAYRAVLEGDEVRTYGPDVEWAPFRLAGHVEGAEERAVLSVQGALAPCREILRPTFRLSGTLTNAEVSDLQMVFGDLGLKSGQVNLRGEVEGVEGRFSDEKSWVDVRLRNMKGTLLMGIELPELDVTVPVQGTVAKPKVNLLKTLGLNATKAAVEDVANLANGLLKGFKKAGRKEKRAKEAVEPEPESGVTNAVTIEAEAGANRVGAGTPSAN